MPVSTRTKSPTAEVTPVTLSVRLLSLERLSNTRDGNPRWALNTSIGRLLTERDHAEIAAITGYEKGLARLKMRNGAVLAVELV